MATQTILFFGASPNQHPLLNIDVEFREVQRAFDRDPNIRVIHSSATTLNNVPGFLQRHPAQLVHFAGHGSKNALILMDDSENPVEVEIGAIGRWISAVGKSVQIVVLNACFTAEQARQLAHFVDCTIGIDSPVRDENALEFTSLFYESLSLGRSVQTAFDVATARRGNGSHAHLFRRNGVDPNAVFLVPPAAEDSDETTKKPKSKTLLPGPPLGEDAEGLDPRNRPVPSGLGGEPLKGMLWSFYAIAAAYWLLTGPIPLWSIWVTNGCSCAIDDLKTG